MISITLPSIHPEALERALDNIAYAAHGEVEVVVVSPQRPRPRDLKVIWLREETPQGANAAHGRALSVSTGEHVLAWVDDHDLMPAWDRLALRNFEARATKVQPFCLGLRQFERPEKVGTCFGIYYPYFPLMRRADAARGFWLTGDYRVGFADADLGMRVWNAGGICEWSSERLVRVLPDDDRKKLGKDWSGDAHTSAPDELLFVARWGQRFGAGYDTSHLRGFNIDVPLDMLPAGARTIWKGQAQ